MTEGLLLLENPINIKIITLSTRKGKFFINDMIYYLSTNMQLLIFIGKRRHKWKTESKIF